MSSATSPAPRGSSGHASEPGSTPVTGGRGQPLTVVSGDHRHDPARLAAIAELGLLDDTHDQVFDRASRLASHLLGAEIALVSIVTGADQRLLGASGLSEPFPQLEVERATPLSHSFCQYVVRDRSPLVVDDATTHPLVTGSLAISELGIEAYLGVPLRDADGRTLGALCVIERHPRTWTDEERRVLEQLGELVRTELLLRGQLERLSRATLSREERWRGAAHDLRAAIHGIMGAATTLMSGRATDTALRDELLAMVLRQSERSDALLTTVLDRPEVARVGAGPVELHRVVEAAAVTATAALGQQARVSPHLEAVTLRTDADAVERIVLNLVRNALQHTDGPVEIRTGIDHELAVVHVRDHGPGLPGWLLSEGLGAGARRSRGKGHGIGLFSAVTLARTIGAQLTAESSADGASLRLLLPLSGATSTGTG
jgi:signal transduction histidine kinase